MTSVYPIPTGRTSGLLTQSRLVEQLQADQLDLLRYQNQVSTGRRVILPSEDASASIRGMGLQSLLEQKEQVSTNLTTSRSYLSATESAISGVGDLLHTVRGAAVSVSDTTKSDLEIQTVSETIKRAIDQILNISNTQFRDRYLFSGSETQQIPFERGEGFI
ncbi:MAG: hypothetical protein MPJ24_10770, partial [Pirellulaceae bacterium]|nr:hypothetical protein [Pirellulaceae bacterium]